MLTIKQCRQIEPSLSELSDEEIVHLRDSMYELATLAFESTQKQGGVSKNPTWVMPTFKEDANI
ncbi:MAG: hypothetical protein WCV85_05115 [Patescibacteria group bacterium]